MKNIIFSNYDDMKNPYYGGGGAYAIHQMSKRLSQNHKILVITGKYPNAKNELVNGVYYKRIGLSTNIPKLDQLIYQIYLHYYALTKDYDIWFESLTPPFSFSFLPKISKKPVIAVVHMLSGEDMQRKYHLPFVLIQNMGLKMYRNFIVLSDSMKKRIKNINEDANVSVIPNGIDLPKKNPNPKKNTILFIGRIEINQKGLDLLLKAWKNIYKKVSYKLVIAGSGENREIGKLKNIIKEQGLGNSVEYIGKVSGDKKDHVFRKALYVVSTSRFETFSITALEAMSYKLPFICFDINGFSWLSKDLCIKTKKFETKELAYNMLRLARDKKLRDRLVNATNHVIDGYKWENIAILYENYIDSFQKNMPVDAISEINKFKNKRLIFISPHLDDAVFSAGGLLNYLSKKNKILLINIFTKASNGPYTMAAKKYLRLSGQKKANILFSERVREDNNAFKTLNIKSIDLKFTDASFRKKEGRFWNIFQNIIPEITHIYPFYKQNILKGKISKYDIRILSRIYNKLKRIIKRDDIVFCPLSAKSHIDHVIVRKIVEQFDNRKYFWVDYPYNVRYEYEENKYNKYFTFNLHQKNRINIMNKYTSQIRGLEKGILKSIPPEKYYF